MQSRYTEWGRATRRGEARPDLTLRNQTRPAQCWHDWEEQFETDRDGVAIAETCRIVCKECGDTL